MRENKEWQLRFAFLPHRCKISDKWFWLSNQYICITEIHNQRIHIITKEWYSKKEAIEQMSSYFRLFPDQQIA
jgi:hypothetical protein